MFKTLKKSIQMGLALKRLRNASEVEKEKAISYLKEVLGEETGVFAKLSQYLGSNKYVDQDLLYSKQQLLTTKDIEIIFEETFNFNFQENFNFLDHPPLKASIGQVHIIENREGEKLALKVQYPGIKKTIEDQLKLLNLFPIAEKVSPLKKWGIPISNYQKLFKEVLDEELNYLQEIKNQNYFKELNSSFSKIPNGIIKTSEINSEFQSPHIYLQSYIDGICAKDVPTNFSFNQIEYLGMNLFQSFLEQIFKFRFIQCDSNHGNFLFSNQGKEPQIYFLDFGSCKSLSKKFTYALGKLIIGTIEKRDIDPLPLLGDMGFDIEKLVYIQKQLPKTLEALFDPLFNDYPYDLRKWNLDEKLNQVLGNQKWWFRSAGGTEFFTVMKAFSGYKSLFINWGLSLCWKKVFYNVIEADFESFLSYKPQTAPRQMAFTFNSVAKNLRVLVTENGKEKVNLTMPAQTIENLSSYMDSSILDKLPDRGIYLTEISKRIIEDGVYPGEVFTLEEGEKTYRVFLD